MKTIQSIDISQKKDMTINALLDGNFYLITQNGKPVAEINPVITPPATAVNGIKLN